MQKTAEEQQRRPKPVRVSSHPCFSSSSCCFCQDLPSEDDKNFRPQRWRTTGLLPPPTSSGDRRRRGRGHSQRSNAKASKSRGCDCRWLELLLKVIPSEFSDSADGKCFLLEDGTMDEPQSSEIESNLITHYTLFFFLLFKSHSGLVNPLNPVWLMLLMVNVSRAAKQTNHLWCCQRAAANRGLRALNAATTNNARSLQKKKKKEGLRGVAHCWCLHHHIGKCTCKNRMCSCKTAADHKKHMNSFVLRQIENSLFFSSSFFFEQRSQFSHHEDSHFSYQRLEWCDQSEWNTHSRPLGGILSVCKYPDRSWGSEKVTRAWLWTVSRNK